MTLANTLSSWLAHELQSRSGFRWDKATARFRSNATGRFVAERDVFGAVDDFREFVQDNIEEHTQRMLDGRITLAEWQERMRQEVVDSRMVAHMAGRGGRNAMTQEDWGRLGGRVSNDLRHLDTFAFEIKAGMLSAALILSRASLYGERTSQSYSDGALTAASDAGRFLVWHLGATEEHCTDCFRLNGQVHTPQEWYASGWQPQSLTLECGGWRCDCRLVPTDGPSSGSF